MTDPSVTPQSATAPRSAVAKVAGVVRLNQRNMIPTNIAVSISKPPGFHWFGYYDKFQFDVTGRYVLGMQVDFEHRLPNAADVVKIGIFDLADNNKWIELGESNAWCWQQGCMLQWRPGSACEIVWNDREGNRFVCRILNIETRQIRTLPRAIGTISPCGRFALCEDFSRIWNFRPGYAYAGVADPYTEQKAPPELGVWRMNMDTGDVQQIISLAELAKISYPDQKPEDSHYINHLAWNPTGERFLMFNRWSGAGQPTRVFTAAGDGSDLRLLSAHGASHWTWRDSQHVLIWAEGAYRLYRDDGAGEPIETVYEHPNGHQTFIPGMDNEWLLSDTYPQGLISHQELFLYHIPSRTKVMLGCFDSPSGTSGEANEWRCDLHPRLNRMGTKVAIDSTHEGRGRQMYLIDIEDILVRGTK